MIVDCREREPVDLLIRFIDLLSQNLFSMLYRFLRRRGLELLECCVESSLRWWLLTWVVRLHCE
jgi:hypothetical protein